MSARVGFVIGVLLTAASAATLPAQDSIPSVVELEIYATALEFYSPPRGQVRWLESPVQREALVGSSRVDLQACKLEYSIVSPK